MQGNKQNSFAILFKKSDFNLTVAFANDLNFYPLNSIMCFNNREDVYFTEKNMIRKHKKRMNNNDLIVN